MNFILSARISRLVAYCDRLLKRLEEMAEMRYEGAHWLP